MRNLIAAVLVTLAPALSSAGVYRSAAPPEVSLYTHYRAALIATGAALGGHVLPARGFRVTAIVMQTTAAASGAGNVTLRVTDGTRNCDAAVSCVTAGGGGFGDAGPKRFAPTTGTCDFPASALLTTSVVTSGCATTQPNVLITTPVGLWR
jgi:hypothetical protein